MKIHHREFEGGIWIEISGHIDESHCHCLSHFWDKCVAEDVKSLEMDFAKVVSLDDHAIQFLCETARRHLRKEAKIECRNLPETLMKSLTNFGLSRKGERILLATAPEPN